MLVKSILTLRILVMKIAKGFVGFLCYRVLLKYCHCTTATINHYRRLFHTKIGCSSSPQPCIECWSRPRVSKSSAGLSASRHWSNLSVPLLLFHCLRRTRRRVYYIYPSLLRYLYTRHIANKYYYLYRVFVWKYIRETINRSEFAIYIPYHVIYIYCTRII